jgi:hypothetical protein
MQLTALPRSRANADEGWPQTIGNVTRGGCDSVFMPSGSEVPEQEWRSYVDNEDSDEHLAPDPFTLPLPTPPEQGAEQVEAAQRHGRRPVPVRRGGSWFCC